MAWLTRSDILVGIEETDEGVPAAFKICCLLHVTAIEPLAHSRTGKTRKRRSDGGP